MKFKMFLFQPPVHFGEWTFNNVMLSMPINCRRNLNCVRGEKVAFHGPILLYQFAIIKLTKKLLMKSKLETPTYNNNNNKLEIRYQLALPFPGIPTWSFFELFMTYFQHFQFLILIVSCKIGNTKKIVIKLLKVPICIE